MCKYKATLVCYLHPAVPQTSLQPVVEDNKCTYSKPTHIHLMRVLNTVFTCSRSRLWWTCRRSWTKPTTVCGRRSPPRARRNIAPCFIDVRRGEDSAAGASPARAEPDSTQRGPRWFSSSPPPPYCFQYCCCVSCGLWEKRRGGNWETSTGFNKGAGLNGGSEAAAEGPPRHVAGVRKDPGGPGGWLWERLWSAAGNRHCQCTGHLETGDTISCG